MLDSMHEHVTEQNTLQNAVPKWNFHDMDFVKIVRLCGTVEPQRFYPENVYPL